ncbi:hypothetical protein [Enterobacter cloacae]|nr:hypothetical protein [Enterobacter cloacae]
MLVSIEGVIYTPIRGAEHKIGISISTHNRSEIVKIAMELHIKFLPHGAMLVVKDDGSKLAAIEPEGMQLLRYEISHRIVAAKNASHTCRKISTGHHNI